MEIASAHTLNDSNAIKNIRIWSKKHGRQAMTMTWPYSKHIISTDDQTEISGTTETIRKDRILQKSSRLRWEKTLRDELGRLKTEKMLSEKKYTFEKHYYETKLKDFKGKGLLSAADILYDKTSRKDGRLNHSLVQVGVKEDIKRRFNTILENKLLDSTVFLQRKDIKWSLNDATDKKERKNVQTMRKY